MANENNKHQIYDELKRMAEQTEFSMHCVTLHYSVDGFTAMAHELRDIHYAVLDKIEMDGAERSECKEHIAQFFDDAVQMRKTIEILRLREMKRKGRPSSED